MTLAPWSRWRCDACHDGLDGAAYCGACDHEYRPPRGAVDVSVTIAEIVIDDDGPQPGAWAR